VVKLHAVQAHHERGVVKRNRATWPHAPLPAKLKEDIDGAPVFGPDLGVRDDAEVANVKPTV
jgi:hypothetical protein